MKVSYRSGFNRTLAFIALTAFIIVVAACKKGDFHFPGNQNDIQKIKHVVVIYLENHSFDNLYGEFGGANGLSHADASNTIQVDSNGNPYTYLPPIAGTTAFPTTLP